MEYDHKVEEALRMIGEGNRKRSHINTVLRQARKMIANYMNGFGDDQDLYEATVLIDAVRG